MSQYYFLVSSLHHLILDNEKRVITTSEFLDLCEREMSGRDYDELRKIYIFNDITNSVDFEKSGLYRTPSYYSKEEFDDNRKDTDIFFPFLAEYYFNKKSEKRLFPEINETDEVLQLFYENIDTFGEGFVIDYFLFELNLRNISIAIGFRDKKVDFSNRIIKFGDFYEKLLKNTNTDFGLSDEFPFVERLIEVYKSGDLLMIERKMEDIRWEWLDEYTSMDTFSKNIIYSYAVKLISVERWLNMNKKKGEEIFNKLIGQIRGSIKFSENFMNIGGKK